MTETILDFRFGILDWVDLITSKITWYKPQDDGMEKKEKIGWRLLAATSKAPEFQAPSFNYGV